jgi:hypothetical protein
MFRNVFLVQTATPAGSVVREDALSVTTIVPVADKAAAVEAVRSLGQIDLVELYGGLGIEAAAAVVAAAPGVPVGFAGDMDAESAQVVILYEEEGADPAVDRWTFGTRTVVAVPSTADAPAVAAEFVAKGATRVELCGGMGPVPAAAVRKVVDVPVTTVLFGFESLAAAAAYQARYAEEATSLRPNS